MLKKALGNQRGELLAGAPVRADLWWIEPLIVSWSHLSPAFLILWIPGGFRATCYYYRKAYYRSFFGLPPGCAVRDVSKSYSGETRFPFVLQNIHRHFLWLGIPVIEFL